MENKIITTDLGQAVFKIKHDMPMSENEYKLIKCSSSARMLLNMSEANKIEASLAKKSPQFILYQQAAASEDVGVEEIFVTSADTKERVFSLQIEKDEDDEQYYIVWYFVDHSDYISKLLADCPSDNESPVIRLYFATDIDLASELREQVSSITITGELTPESLYDYHLSPKEALKLVKLKQGDFMLEIDHV